MTTISDLPFDSTRLARAAAAVLLAASPASRAGTPINERAAADPTGSVEVSNVSGTVTVTGGDRGNQVEVTGDARRRYRAPGLHHPGQGDPDQGRPARASPTTSTTPTSSSTCPRPAGLSVNTVSADITVQGVTGAQRLQSVSGDIRTEAVGSEDVECKTVSGDVAVDGSGKKGLLAITTVSGDATALKVAGEVNANTVSGNLVLGLGETERSRAALDQRRPGAGHAAGCRRQGRRREHLRRRAGQPGGRRRRGVRHLDVQRRHPQLLRSEARFHQRIRAGPGACASARARERPGSASRP